MKCLGHFFFKNIFHKFFGKYTPCYIMNPFTMTNNHTPCISQYIRNHNNSFFVQDITSFRSYRSISKLKNIFGFYIISIVLVFLAYSTANEVANFHFFTLIKEIKNKIALAIIIKRPAGISINPEPKIPITQLKLPNINPPKE